MTRPGDVLLRRGDLVVESFDDAVLVWDAAANRLHHLDAHAALVWDELDGRSLTDIAADLTAALGAPATLLDDLVTLGDRLLTERLVRRPSS